MDKTCDLDKLYERKFPKRDLPLSECVSCLFNVLCLDYSTYDKEMDSLEKSESTQVENPIIER